MDLVHIQECAVELPAIELLVHEIDQLTHRSFLQLLKVMQHGQRYFLVWEPTEFSLHEVLASKCRITECELAQIAWPILKGLRFLRDQCRAIVSLTPRDILFTESGGVKIAFFEKSCKTNSSNAGTMPSSVNSLRLLVEQLMEKNGTDFSWSKDAQNFKTVLADSSSAELLDDLLRHPFFGQMDGRGGLKMLVQLVNKTAYHEVKLYRKEK
ncbi:hypothetical protein BJX63DRAFT_438586 [Aspergillus granulosus]|uniref:Protein kinase domain-containing protein n=1 Tax=Aspergillus granulosus TaxID=176169 RepID=A0ABR4GRJ2_9EURO